MHAYGSRSDTFAGLDLSDEQRSKISMIQRDLRSRQLKFMGELHDQCDRRAEAQDDEVASKTDEQTGALRRQLLGNANAAHKVINAVLTKEQRRQLWRGGD